MELVPRERSQSWIHEFAVSLLVAVQFESVDERTRFGWYVYI